MGIMQNADGFIVLTGHGDYHRASSEHWHEFNNTCPGSRQIFLVAGNLFLVRDSVQRPLPRRHFGSCRVPRGVLLVVRALNLDLHGDSKRVVPDHLRAGAVVDPETAADYRLRRAERPDRH
jgi:hypothetical protein